MLISQLKVFSNLFGSFQQSQFFSMLKKVNDLFLVIIQRIFFMKGYMTQSNSQAY